MFENFGFFKFQSRYRLRKKSVKFFIPILFLIAFFVVLVTDKDKKVNLFSSFTTSLSSFFVNNMDMSILFFDKFKPLFLDNYKLVNEIKALEKEINHLKVINNSLFIKINDFEKIKKILEKNDETECLDSITRVLGVENIFPRSFLYAERSSNFNPSKDQLVLSDFGLVGRISDYTEKKIKILLITDFYSRVPVIVKETGEQAIVQGQGNDELRVVFIDQMISSVEDLESKLLVTSGIDDFFEPNIPIAKITRSKNGEVFAKPLGDFKTIEFVYFKN